MGFRQIFVSILFGLGMLMLNRGEGWAAPKPLSVEDLEGLLRSGVSPGRVAEIVEEQGVKFEVTAAIRGRLRQAGANEQVMNAVDRASLEVTRRKLEDAQRKAEEATRKAEEQQQKLEEARKQEEARQKEAEKKAAAEAKRQAAKEAQPPVEEAPRRKMEETPKSTTKGDVGAMVQVPAGEFFMGCNERVDTECPEDEKPGRQVYNLEAFRIDKTEVTVAQYSKCVAVGGCSSPNTGGSCNYGQGGGGNHPVNCVDWAQADAYCRWAGKRLPTEQEWEKAARGTNGYKYPWGNEWNQSRANTDGSGDGYSETAPVGSFPTGASPYGVLDMAGNVWEWTADWYDAGQTKRAVRGGSWYARPRVARASLRGRDDPGGRNGKLGFRCAR